MKKYIHTFETDSEMQSAYDDWSSYTSPWVSASKEGGILYNNKDYVEIPSGYTIVKSSKGSIWNNLTVDSSNYAGEITSSLLYYSEYNGVGLGNRYFFYNGEVYKPQQHNLYNEFDHYSTSLPDGNYQVIYLKK